jgi:hypothetical protein
MRKRIVAPAAQDAAPGSRAWLYVEELAEVEITSEEEAHLIESALLPGRQTRWRAAQPGLPAARMESPGATCSGRG